MLDDGYCNQQAQGDVDEGYQLYQWYKPCCACDVGVGCEAGVCYGDSSGEVSDGTDLGGEEDEDYDCSEYCRDVLYHVGRLPLMLRASRYMLCYRWIYFPVLRFPDW